MLVHIVGYLESASCACGRLFLGHRCCEVESKLPFVIKTIVRKNCWIRLMSTFSSDWCCKSQRRDAKKFQTLICSLKRVHNLNLFFSFQKILSSIVISFTKRKCTIICLSWCKPEKKGAKYSTNKENLCIWVSQSVFSCYRKVLQKVSFRRRSVKGEKKIVGRILPPPPT